MLCVMSTMSRSFPVFYKHFSKGLNQWLSRPVSFEECLVDLLGSSASKTYIGVAEDKLFIIPSSDYENGYDNTENEIHGPIKITHPEFCPISNIDNTKVKEITVENSERGVLTGVCILVESADGRVLITRRSAQMRTFPLVWVPPGGHIEHGESLQVSSFRELEEETKLKLGPEVKVNILGAWESVYPPMLTLGVPQRHHLVLYLHALLDKCHSEITALLYPDPNEVDAIMWISKQQASFIVGASTTFDNPFQIYKSGNNGRLERENICASKICTREVSLLQERISTGTRYALSLWLDCKPVE